MTTHGIQRLAIVLVWLMVLGISATAPQPCVAQGSAAGEEFGLTLGAKPSFGLFQPRVTVQLFDDAETLVGPNTSANFLLDTGASGALAFKNAVTELVGGGYQIDGTYEEAGIAGTELLDVSAPYQLRASGTDGMVVLDGMRILSDADRELDPTGLQNLHGIIGMPAMNGRVTTMDNTTRTNALSLSMGVRFSDELPDSATHRFTVPLSPVEFPINTDGPAPTFAPLPAMQVISRAGGNLVTDELILDSGAQMTILSTATAFALGLDKNGDGDLLDDARGTIPIGGIGGTINAPILTIDEMRVPTNQGFHLVWTDAEVIVQDIIVEDGPAIAGVLGADAMTGDGGLDLSFISGGGDSGLGDLLGGSGLGDLLSVLGIGDIDGLEGLSELFNDELLGGLFQELFGGSGDLFDTLPLESYFDRVHFDFRDFQNGNGQLIYDLSPTLSSQVLNGDGKFDIADIDELTLNLGSTAVNFDLDQDGTVTSRDHNLLVRDVLGTRPGDLNLDLLVNFSDFVSLASNFGESGGWGDGDFTGDGKIDFADFVLLSSEFESPAANQPSQVPEPIGGWPLLCSGLAIYQITRRTVQRRQANR